MYFYFLITYVFLFLGAAGQHRGGLLADGLGAGEQGGGDDDGLRGAGHRQVRGLPPPQPDPRLPPGVRRLPGKAERTLSPHDRNRHGLPLPSTPFNPSLSHRGIHVTAHTELMRFMRHSCRFMSCGLGVRRLPGNTST